MKVIYVTAETFTNELINAISNRTANAKFKNKYRTADVLLIDDIHFIADKVSTQEEIFHTFNELTEKNKQIVFTCDRPLTELTGINERLITRFRKGANVDLQPPQYETRMAIALKKCKDLNFKISQDVLEYTQIDGCSSWQRVFHIELPLILGQIKLLLILGLINTLQNITLPLLMTNGGPGYDSYTPGLYMYFQAFRLGSYSMANTIATVMFVIILVLTIISTRLRSKMDA